MPEQHSISQAAFVPSPPRHNSVTSPVLLKVQVCPGCLACPECGILGWPVALCTLCCGQTLFSHCSFWVAKEEQSCGCSVQAEPGSPCRGQPWLQLQPHPLCMAFTLCLTLFLKVV